MFPEPDEGLSPEPIRRLLAEVDHPVVVDLLPGLAERQVHRLEEELLEEALGERGVEHLGADAVGGHVLQSLLRVPPSRTRVVVHAVFHAGKAKRTIAVLERHLLLPKVRRLRHMRVPRYADLLVIRGKHGGLLRRMRKS